MANGLLARMDARRATGANTSNTLPGEMGDRPRFSGPRFSRGSGLLKTVVCPLFSGALWGSGLLETVVCPLFSFVPYFLRLLETVVCPLFSAGV